MTLRDPKTGKTFIETLAESLVQELVDKGHIKSGDCDLAALTREFRQQLGEDAPPEFTQTVNIALDKVKPS